MAAILATCLRRCSARSVRIWRALMLHSLNLVFGRGPLSRRRCNEDCGSAISGGIPAGHELRLLVLRRWLLQPQFPLPWEYPASILQLVLQLKLCLVHWWQRLMGASSHLILALSVTCATLSRLVHLLARLPWLS